MKLIGYRKKLISFLLALMVNTLIVVMLPSLSVTKLLEKEAIESDPIDSLKVSIARPRTPKQLPFSISQKTKGTAHLLTGNTGKNNHAERLKLNLSISENLQNKTTDLGTIYSEDQVDTDPEKISGPLPEVPDQFSALGLRGEVILEAVIDEKGKIKSLKVLLEEPRNFKLGRIATDAVSRWKFRPAMINRIPVKIKIQIPIKF